MEKREINIFETIVQRLLIYTWSYCNFFFLHSLRNFYWIPLLFIFIFIEETNQARMFLKKHKYFQKQPFADVPQIGALKNFAIFTRKRLCWSLFFNKVAKLTPGILLEKFVNTLTKLHYKIFVMVLAYRYYQKQPPELFCKKRCS